MKTELDTVIFNSISCNSPMLLRYFQYANNLTYEKNAVGKLNEMVFERVNVLKEENK